MNTAITSTFENGFSIDLGDSFESQKTLSKGLNGRIYSKNGKYAFNAIEGSKLEYENNNIVAYLGAHSFKDEFLAFCKILKTDDLPTQETVVEEYEIQSGTFTVEDTDRDGVISFTNQFSSNSEFLTNTTTVVVTQTDPYGVEINYSNIPNNADEFDLNSFYRTYQANSNRAVCVIDLDNIPPNNADYFDAMYVFKKDNNGNLVGTLVWYGYQNWPLTGKITTEGVEENQFNKKVYYTDAVNERRLVNLKDPQLLYRQGIEFNQIVNNTLLQPEIVEMTNGGQLKAMSVFYLYRIISENGQTSPFSPGSFMHKVIVEDEAIEYAGGNISENTGKKVRVKCSIPSNVVNSEIECFAVEYEALGAPTGIKRLGLKPAQNVVFFDHLGNEETAPNITFDDLTENRTIWKYCNDFLSEKNKLVAVGLRNDPLPTIFNQLDYLLPLHSWNKNGDTHDSLYNPEPWNYRMIDPTVTDSYYTSNKKVYYSLSVYGPTTISLRNTITGDSVSWNLSGLAIDSYTDITDSVSAWLLMEQDNNLDWETFFPNLVINVENDVIVFSRIDEGIETNINNYAIESTNSQYIEEVQANITFQDPGVNASNLVWGAQSLGFNDGVGVRITYREFKEPVLNQATAEYNGTDELLDFVTPTGNKNAMKGEIYRIGFEASDKSSNPLFTIPLGDIMIPKMGDFKSSVDDSGNPILTNERYVNQSVENGVLYAHGVRLHIEVRLSCELQQFISMYRLMYVERTEENRTILCQGISAPMMKIQDDNRPDNRIPDDLRDKWILPYYGGPVYEQTSFENYDINGENFVHPDRNVARMGLDPKDRVMQHRAFMYFDSPDLYYNKISSDLIEDSKLQVIGKLKTDHNPDIIMNRGTSFLDLLSFLTPLTAPTFFAGEEVYPKFSRKIKEAQILDLPNGENLPQGSGSDGQADFPDMFFINVSVYSNYQRHNEEFELEAALEMRRGEVTSGSPFNLVAPVSNNALVLPYQPWFFGKSQREWDYADNGNLGRARHQLYKTARTSPGYKTIFLKTKTDLFTEEFVGDYYPVVNPQIAESQGRMGPVNDTLPLINIYRGNQESVYGGRSKEAYTRNTYIPFTKSIPVLESSNDVQYFDAGIDVYTTLNIRVKNDFSNEEFNVVENVRNNDEGLNNRGSFNQRRRPGAWMYAVVLETQVEPKLSSDYEPYRGEVPHAFNRERNELLNPAYFQTLNYKSAIVKPFKYKDDPNQVNEVAVSNVKFAGENIDNWTQFKVNNIYPLLDKNKGIATNIIKFEERVFVVQEHQTSMVLLGTDRMITDQQGNPISIKQGSGEVVEGHQVVSEYGTSHRRAVAVGEKGFAFYDERKNEFVYNNNPLLVKRHLAIEFLDRYKNNKISNVEPYYDPEKKEININLKAKNGNVTMLSFNEEDQVFNGEYEIDSSLFIQFDNNVFCPKVITGDNPLSSELHKLNYGNFLNLLGEQKDLVVETVIRGRLEDILLHRELQIVCNNDYGLKSIFAKSNIGYDRTVDFNHPRYRIREGLHSVPLLIDSIKLEDGALIRGNNITVKITAESQNNQPVQISGLIHGVRLSHK